MSHRWHALPADEVLELLDSDQQGLGPAEAEARLERHGPNRLTPLRPVSPWRILVDQFTSMVVLLLLAAAVVAFLVGDRLEAAAIAVVLALNTGLGFAVELRARRAMEALLRYQVPEARALRDGAVTTLPADRLVPGDVIALEAGDAVRPTPAWSRPPTSGPRKPPLIGESLPVGKTVVKVAPEAPLAERSSVVYTGTTLVAGRARAVVVATGSETEGAEGWRMFTPAARAAPHVRHWHKYAEG